MSIQFNDDRPLVKVNPRDANKIIVQEVNNQVKVAGWGPQGIAGPAGPAGPVGKAGKYTVSETAPSDNLEQGDLWFKSDTGQLYFYYDSYWVETSTSYAGPQGEQGIPASTPTETSFTVNGGTTGTQPTFNGAPLFDGSYVKNGIFVNFRINVLMTNITGFGSGQYFVDLPFTAKYGYQMRNGCIHDGSNGKQYAISGHVNANSSRLYLFYTAPNGQDADFTQSSPIGLATIDSFHIAGNYIAVS